MHLAEEGANFNQGDYRGRGPIHIAAMNGNYDAVKFFIERGDVNLDLQDRDGRTALYFAAVRKHLRVANLLMDAGAMLNVNADKLVNVLCDAVICEDVELLGVLIKAEVELNGVNFDGRNFGHVAAHEGKG